MKTKRTIYFLLMIVGALMMGLGKFFNQAEYVWCVGIVLLMFGIYKSSQSWGQSGNDTEPPVDNEKR